MFTNVQYAESSSGDLSAWSFGQPRSLGSDPSRSDTTINEEQRTAYENSDPDEPTGGQGEPTRPENFLGDDGLRGIAELLSRLENTERSSIESSEPFMQLLQNRNLQESSYITRRRRMQEIRDARRLWRVGIGLHFEQF